MPYVTSWERMGMKKGVLKSIQLVLESKFGEEGQALVPEVAKIKDQEKLEGFLQKIVKTPKISALQRWLAKQGS